MKKYLSFFLVLMLVVSSSVSVYAENSVQRYQATQAARDLYDMGLFSGTGTDEEGYPILDLDRAPTRQEAITLLINLLGKTEEAKNGNWPMPFNDVDNWAKPYVGYAYANGISSGLTSTTFGAKNKVSAAQYITFVLSALGYEAGKDFQWNKAWELSDKIGLTDGRYNANTTVFLRRDLAYVSYKYLSCENKDLTTSRNQLNQEKKGSDIFKNIPAATSEQKKNYKLFNQYFTNLYMKKMPKGSKGFTLTWDEARALVNQDIETVKKYVCTLEDCLLYLCASGHKQLGVDLVYETDSLEWHFNRSPEIVFAKKGGNCGGNSGLVAYLLEDDYDEVGFVGMNNRVHQGGHVANYLKNGNQYYVFDVNQFVGDYKNGLNFNVATDLPRAVKKSFGKNLEEKEPIMMAYTYVTRIPGDAPIGWSNQPGSVIPMNFIKSYQIIFESPEEGYVYKEFILNEKTFNRIISMRTK